MLGVGTAGALSAGPTAEARESSEVGGGRDRDRLHVTPEMFGSGPTAVQEAIRACPRGGRVLLTKKYRTNPIVLTPRDAGKAIVGLGSSLPRAVDSGPGAALYLVDGADEDVIAIRGTAGERVHILLDRFKINGNKARNGRGNGLSVFQVKDVRIGTLYVEDCAGHGLEAGLSHGNTNQLEADYLEVQNCNGRGLNLGILADSDFGIVKVGFCTGIGVFGLGWRSPSRPARTGSDTSPHSTIRIRPRSCTASFAKTPPRTRTPWGSSWRADPTSSEWARLLQRGPSRAGPPPARCAGGAPRGNEPAGLFQKQGQNLERLLLHGDAAARPPQRRAAPRRRPRERSRRARPPPPSSHAVGPPGGAPARCSPRKASGICSASLLPARPQTRERGRRPAARATETSP